MVFEPPRSPRGPRTPFPQRNGGPISFFVTPSDTATHITPAAEKLLEAYCRENKIDGGHVIIEEHSNGCLALHASDGMTLVVKTADAGLRVVDHREYGNHQAFTIIAALDDTDDTCNADQIRAKLFDGVSASDVDVFV